MQELVEANRMLLQQAADLLAGLDDDAYNAACPACFDSTVGGHLRHVLEHYRSFIGGLESGEIDYDLRERGSPVERSVVAAAAEVTLLLAAMEHLHGSSARSPLLIMVDDGGRPRTSLSNVERELQFLLSHSVHHYALIRTILNIQGLRCAVGEFGVAPSTLRYRQQLSAAEA